MGCVVSLAAASEVSLTQLINSWVAEASTSCRSIFSYTFPENGVAQAE